MFRWAVQGLPVSPRSRGGVEVVDSTSASAAVRHSNVWASSTLPLAHPTHALATSSCLCSLLPPHCSNSAQGLNASQRSAAPGCGLPLHIGPHLAVKVILSRHKFVNIFHLLNSLSGYSFPACMSPLSWERIPHILVPSSLPHPLSCHVPGDTPCYSHLPAFSQTVSFTQNISHTPTLVLQSPP